MTEISETSTLNFHKEPSSHVSDPVREASLVEAVQRAGNDLTNILTLKIRMVNQLMMELGLPLSFCNHIQATSTPVHPEVAKELLRWAHKQENVDALLAQDFVLNEKLHKLIKAMCKSGHINLTHALLAIDGLNGKLNQGPNLECKKYIENLKYSLSGEPGRYDREANDKVKRAHVNAIRKVYQELDKHRSSDAKLVDGVYNVMCLVLRDMASIELPVGEQSTWSEQVLHEAANVYKANMKEEYFKIFVEMLKMKISNGNNSNTSDDEESIQNKRKREK